MTVVNRFLIFINMALAGLPASLDASPINLARLGKTGNSLLNISLDQQRRLDGWRDFVKRNRKVSPQRKLQLVNAYLNQFEYQSDKPTHGTAEYWETPYEFILQNGGDCEDFAIAKYFLLRSLEVPEERLQITYAYQRELKQYHMVLLYMPLKQGRPQVLDNLTNTIQFLTDRADIEPIYGFNQHHLWIVNKVAQRTQVGGPSRLFRWQALLGRMRLQPLGSLDMNSG